MKVYVVTKFYDNCESYEDHYWHTSVLDVFATKEAALAYIKDINIIPADDGDGFHWSEITSDVFNDSGREIIETEHWVELVNKHLYLFDIKEFEVKGS